MLGKTLVFVSFLYSFCLSSKTYIDDSGSYLFDSSDNEDITLSYTDNTYKTLDYSFGEGCVVKSLYLTESTTSTKNYYLQYENRLNDFIFTIVSSKNKIVHVYIGENSIVLNMDQLGGTLILDYKDTFFNSIFNPYVFVQSSIDLTINVTGNFSFDLCNYAFTVFGESTINFVGDENYTVVASNNISDATRYFICPSTITSIDDSYCIPQGDSTSDGFNYPDCELYSSYFTLELNSPLTFEETSEWSNIIANTGTEINVASSAVLTVLETLTIQTSISSTGELIVNEMVISDISSLRIFEKNKELFFLALSSSSVPSSIESIDCDYSDNLYRFQTDSSYYLTLSLEDSSYEISTDISFKTIEFGLSTLTTFELIQVSSYSNTLTPTNCIFYSDSSVIGVDTTCDYSIFYGNSIEINSNVIISSTLELRQTTENIPLFNGSNIIQMNGDEIILYSGICLDLYSNSDVSSIGFPILINSDVTTLTLASNKLLRVCPTNLISNKVICVFETPSSFPYYHCPCINEDATECVLEIDSSLSSSELDLSSYSPTYFQINNPTIELTSNSTIPFQTTSDVIFYGNVIVYLINSISDISLTFNESSYLYSIYSTFNIPIYVSSSLKSIDGEIITITTSDDSYCTSAIITSSDIICLSCIDGYYLVNSVCVSAIIVDYCTSYTTNGICSYCEEYFYITNNFTCSSCPSNCKHCNSTMCFQCDNGFYVNEQFECSSQSSNCIETVSNRCIKCNDGLFTNSDGTCSNCTDNCNMCTTLSECTICDIDEKYYEDSGSCLIPEGSTVVSNQNIVSCNETTYLLNNQCLICNTLIQNCITCDNNVCMLCEDDYLLINNECVYKTNVNCDFVSNSICIGCLEGYSFDENKCSLCNDNCKACDIGNRNDCYQCDDGYYNHNGICETTPNDNCEIEGSHNCERCISGYYLNDGLCSKCSDNCVECYDYDICSSCEDNQFLDNGNCTNSNEGCKISIPGQSSCAVCENGYYRNDGLCDSCDISCSRCIDGYSCMTCADQYFWRGDSLCTSYDELYHCLNDSKTSNGCTECEDYYYVLNYICSSCPSHCIGCNSKECTSCDTNYVLVNGECVHFSTITNCVESSSNKCSKCSGWNTPTDDGSSCVQDINVGIIVAGIFFILLLIFVFCVFIIFVVYYFRQRIPEDERNKQLTIFDFSKSNAKFNPITNDTTLLANKTVIEFDDKVMLPVNEESRDLICVANNGKQLVKVQFVSKEAQFYFKFRTEPKLVLLRPGKACEFEVFIKPLCTTQIREKVMLFCLTVKDGRERQFPIELSADTEISTHLNPSELIEEKKIGEGGFGIVYKGTFRDNQVAIKKIKEMFGIDDSMDEFNKEVSMLSKFKSDYIVHFYGAVFIPNKVCLVTEFAEYGSLQDLIFRRKEKPVKDRLKVKMALDCAKGISYLHSNGILHRDIKPDNFLVLSLDTNVQVNAKLTDFGSSRNINMMMTNMTFTKGIGTPKYMAPEVLNRKKYKTQSDIYSFAITMHETFIWGDAYPVDIFKFPWSIAEFVTAGHRSDKPDTMSEELYSILSDSWKQVSKERILIEEVVSRLEKYLANCL
ncbi:Protein serine/threonine kinase [Entamoeba marina]